MIDADHHHDANYVQNLKFLYISVYIYMDKKKVTKTN